METTDTLIIQRLGEYQRKREFITRNLNQQRNVWETPKRVFYYLAAAAACIAVAVAVLPGLLGSNSLSSLNLAEPSFSEYRGGGQYSDIAQAIEANEFDKALSLTNSTIAEVEAEQAAIIATEDGDEEKEYLLALGSESLDELYWTKIYLLAKLGKKDALRQCCANYLDVNQFGRHCEEVQKILGKIE